MKAVALTKPTMRKEFIIRKKKFLLLRLSRKLLLSRERLILWRRRTEKKKKRVSDEINMLLGDLQADGARGSHKELLEELIEQFGSKWATVSKK